MCPVYRTVFTESYVLLKAGRCAYTVAILIVFWVFEVLPLPVTSLLPALLFPVLGVLSTKDVCAEFVKVGERMTRP